MMFIETRGQGPALVLIHGWAMHSGVFAHLLPWLEPHFTVYLVDLPGHGHSGDDTMPLSLEAVTSSLLTRLPPALWMGWSLGGLFALHAAQTQPQAVHGLIMHCATPRFVRAAGAIWPYGISAEILHEFSGGLHNDYRGTLERFLALEALGADDTRATLRELRRELFARGEPAIRALSDGLHLLETSDLRSALPGLRMPSLWLAGQRDRLVDPRAMRMAAQLAPNPTFVQVEHAGHAPFLTHAAEVAQYVLEFAPSLGRDRTSHDNAVSEPASL